MSFKKIFFLSLILLSSCQKGESVMSSSGNGYLKSWGDATRILDSYYQLQWVPCLIPDDYKFERCYMVMSKPNRINTHKDLVGRLQKLNFKVEGNLSEGDLTLYREDLGHNGRIVLMNVDGRISMELYTGSGRAKSPDGQEWHKSLKESAQEMAGIFIKVPETQDRMVACQTGQDFSYCVASSKDSSDLVYSIRDMLFFGKKETFDKKFSLGLFDYDGSEWVDEDGDWFKPYRFQLVGKSPIQFRIVTNRFERIEFDIKLLAVPKGISVPAGTKTLVQIQAKWRPGMKPALAD